MSEKTHFINWYENNLTVDRYPTIKELETKYKDYQVIINVSDEFIFNYHDAVALSENSKKYFWFPMCESATDMGMSSIFGALQVLYNCYGNNLKVLLHCHAGANRSPTVAHCFYYMMTGKHIEGRKTETGIILRDNSLLFNCERKRLPNLQTMETWLEYCKQAFDNPEKFIGGMYDWTLYYAKIYQDNE